MERPGSILFICIVFALLTGCIFAVEHEPVQETAPVTIEGPQEVLVDGAAEFVIEYAIECAGPHCNENLWCNITGPSEESADFRRCDSSFLVTEEDVGQGQYTAVVELRDDDGQVLAGDQRTTEIRFKLSVTVDGLDDLEQPIVYSHPLEVDISCSRSCKISCSWKEVGGDDINDSDTACDEQSATIDLPDEHDEAVLVLQACTDTEVEGNADHCIREKSYHFAYEEPTWKAVDAGSHHSCALLDSHSLWCWGGNQEMQLGIDGGDNGQTEPRQVTTRPFWRDVATGYEHTCAIDYGGDLYCWGENSGGQSDPGSALVAVAPTLIDASRQWQSVSAGGAHSCGLTSDDELFCWGENDDGQLGNPYDESELRSVETPQDHVRWAQVSAGKYHSCAVAESDDGDKHGFCWGRFDNGRLGLGGDVDGEELPRQILPDSGKEVLNVSAGKAHTCAAIELPPDLAYEDHEGVTLFCWGRGADHRLGQQGTSDIWTPRLVEIFDTPTVISAGHRHSCAIEYDPAGPARCWGYQQGGRLGNGEVDSDSSSMESVDLAVDFIDVAAGSGHSCAISSDGDLYCWGQNNHGQLASGGHEKYAIPESIFWP